MKKIFFLLLVIINYTYIISQTEYKQKVELEKVIDEGFQKILLKPEITSKLKHGFSDLRLFDKENNEIPFIYGSFFGDKTKKRRVFFKIKKNKKNKIKQNTTLILENTKNIIVSNFAFTISNNKNRMILKIYGSNDKKKWYVIKNNFSAQTSYNNIEKKELLINNLPKTNFKFYKILFHNYNKNKTKIHQAFFYEDNDTVNYQQINKKPKIIHKDTLNKTLVYIKFNEFIYIDKIKFNIKGSKYYYRRAEFSKMNNGKNDGVTELFYDDLQKNIIFESDNKNEMILSDFKVKTIKIIIFNKDDSPIRIKSVDIYQKKNFIIAYLYKKKNYYLNYENNAAKFPIYDLLYFKTKIPDTIPILNIKEKLIKNNGRSEKLKWNFPKKYLWIAAFSIGALLLFLTSKIILEKYRNNKFENTDF